MCNGTLRKWYPRFKDLVGTDLVLVTREQTVQEAEIDLPAFSTPPLSGISGPHWVFAAACRFSLAAASGGPLPAAVRRPLTAVASPAVERRPQAHGPQQPRHAGPAAAVPVPSCSAAQWDPPGPGPNLCSLHQQADSQPLRHQGSPGSLIFMEISSLLVWVLE